jgi:hypothetical protein
MPTKRKALKHAHDWFDLLVDDALVREYSVLPCPTNQSPLIDVGTETWRRWGLQGLAPRPIVIASTRHYRVGELRRWLRGEWKPKEVA